MYFRRLLWYWDRWKKSHKLHSQTWHPFHLFFSLRHSLPVFEASLELVTTLPSQHPWTRTMGVRLELALTFPVAQLLPRALLWDFFPLDARNAPHWVLITRTRTTHQTDIPGQTQWFLHKQLLERVSPFTKMLQTSGYCFICQTQDLLRTLVQRSRCSSQYSWHFFHAGSHSP